MSETSRIRGCYMQSPRRNKPQSETLKIKRSRNTYKPFKKTWEGEITFQKLPVETNGQRQEERDYEENLNTSSLLRPGGWQA